MPEFARVVVVGAGPVGLSAAMFLADRGVEVLVLEAADSLPEDMRASTFHPPTLDMLSESGIADTLIAQGHKAPRWQYYDRDSGERIVFDLAVLNDLTGHPYRLQCEQFRLTKAIAERAKRTGAFEILFSAPVTAVRQSSSGVAVVASVDGAESSFEADYVVAADGGRSTMRRLLELPFPGETYPTTSITVVADHRFEDDWADLLWVNYLWTGTDHFSMMRVQNQWRLGFSPAAGETIEAACSEDRVRQRIREFVGATPEGKDIRLLHIGAYSVHRRIIDNFRIGRILFAGDAAHLNSPAGGMGMNSGIHDARLLAENLISVLGGEDERLLDQYARKRRTIAIEEVQKQSDTNYKRHRQKDPEVRKQVWRELQGLAETEQSMRAFLRRTSMIASLEREAAIP